MNPRLPFTTAGSESLGNLNTVVLTLQIALGRLELDPQQAAIGVRGAIAAIEGIIPALRTDLVTTAGHADG